MVHTEENHSKDKDLTSEIPAIMDSEDSLSLTAIGEMGKMTAAMIDHAHRIQEKEFLKAL